MLMGAQLVGPGINVFVSILMRRYLGPERVGVREFITNYGVLLSLISEFGLTRAAIQRISRSSQEDLPEILGHMAVSRWLTTGLYIIILWSSLLLPVNHHVHWQEKLLLMLWSLSIAFQSFRRNGEAAFLATEKVSYQATLFLVNRVVAASAVTAVLLLGDRWINAPEYTTAWYGALAAIFSVYVIADLLDAVAAWVIVKRKIAKPTFDFDWRPKLRLLREGWPFALQMLAGQVYFYSGTLILRYQYPGTKAVVDAEVGFYTTPYNIILVLLQLPISFITALIPRMSRTYHDGDVTRLYSIFTYAWQLTLLSGLPIAAAFFLFRNEFITTVYGAQYAPAAQMMGILSWTLVLAFANTPISNFLACCDRQHFVNVAFIASAIANVLINLVLVPKLGGMGSSWASLSTEFLCFLLLFTFLLFQHRHAVSVRRIGSIVTFQALAATIMIIFRDATVTARLGIYGVYLVIAIALLARLIRSRRTSAA